MFPTCGRKADVNNTASYSSSVCCSLAFLLTFACVLLSQSIIATATTSPNPRTWRWDYMGLFFGKLDELISKDWDDPGGLAMATNGTMYMGDNHHIRMMSAGNITDNVVGASFPSVNTYQCSLMVLSDDESTIYTYCHDKFYSVHSLDMANIDNAHWTLLAEKGPNVRDGMVGAEKKPPEVHTVGGIDAASPTQVIFTDDHCVREYRPDAAIIRTLAGKCGHAGKEDGRGTGATFEMLQDVAVDRLLGIVYIAHARFSLRKMDLTSLQVTTVGAFGNKDATSTLVNLAMFSETSTLFISDRSKEGFYLWTRGAGAMVIDRNLGVSVNGLIGDPTASAKQYNMVVKNPMKNEVYLSDKFSIRSVNGSYYDRTFNIEHINIYAVNEDEKPILFTARYRIKYQYLRHVEFGFNGDFYMSTAYEIFRVPHVGEGRNGVPEKIRADRSVDGYAETPLPDDREAGVAYICSVNKILKYNFTDYGLFQNESTAIVTVDEGLWRSSHGVLWNRFLFYITVIDGWRLLRYYSLDELPEAKIAEGYNRTGQAGKMVRDPIYGATANKHVDRIYFINHKGQVNYVDLSFFLANFSVGPYTRIEHIQTKYTITADRNAMLLLDENTLFISDVYFTYVWDPVAPFPAVFTERMVAGTIDDMYVRDLEDGPNSPFMHRYHFSSLAYSEKDNEIVGSLYNTNKVLLLGTAIREQLKHVREASPSPTPNPLSETEAPPDGQQTTGGVGPTAGPPATNPDGSLVTDEATATTGEATDDPTASNGGSAAPSTDDPTASPQGTTALPPSTPDPAARQQLEELRINDTFCSTMPLHYRVLAVLVGKTTEARSQDGAGTPWLVAAFPPVSVANSTNNFTTPSTATNQVLLTTNQAKSNTLRLVVELTSCHLFPQSSTTTTPQRVAAVSVSFEDGSHLKRLQEQFPGSIVKVEIATTHRQAIIDLNFSPSSSLGSHMELPFHLPLYVPVGSDKEKLKISVNGDALAPPLGSNNIDGRRQTTDAASPSPLSVAVNIAPSDDDVDKDGKLADGLIHFHLVFSLLVALLGGVGLCRISLCGVAARQFALTVLITLTLSRHSSSSSLATLFTPGLTDSLPFAWAPIPMSLSLGDEEDTRMADYFALHAGAIVGNTILVVALSVVILVVWGLVLKMCFPHRGDGSGGDPRSEPQDADAKQRKSTSTVQSSSTTAKQIATANHTPKQFDDIGILHNVRPARFLSFLGFMWFCPTLSSAFVLVVHSTNTSYVILGVVVVVLSVAFLGSILFYTRRCVPNVAGFSLQSLFVEASLSCASSESTTNATRTRTANGNHQRSISPAVSTASSDVPSSRLSDKKDGGKQNEGGVWTPAKKSFTSTVFAFGPLFEDFKPQSRDLFSIDLIVMFFATFIMAIIPANGDHVLYKGGFFFILLAMYFVVFYVTCPELPPLAVTLSNVLGQPATFDASSKASHNSHSSSSLSFLTNFSNKLDARFGNKSNFFHLMTIFWQAFATFVFLMLQSSSDGGNTGTTTLGRDRLLCAFFIFPSFFSVVCLLGCYAVQWWELKRSLSIFSTASSTHNKQQHFVSSLVVAYSPTMAFSSSFVSRKEAEWTKEADTGFSSVHPCWRIARRQREVME